MNQLQIAEYTKLGLSSLTEKLEHEFYGVIRRLCEGARFNIKRIQDLEVHQSTSQYIVNCNKLMLKICNYIQTNADYFVPYMKELDEKTAQKHDCLNCSGGCHMKHQLKLTEFNEVHQSVKDILYRLQMMTLPLHSDTTHPDVYKLLRKQIAQLEASLSDLFFIEEAVLIPKIIVAQKDINVRN